MATPSENDIEVVLNKCAEAEAEGSKFPGMSYEDGVRYTIEWLTEGGESPMTD